MRTIEDIKELIRTVPDFPTPGILFKDITPLLKNAELCKAAAEMMLDNFIDTRIDAIAAIESRGFLLGMLMAQLMGVPFIPIRKKGKLPYKTYSEKYELEYGMAEIEIHIDAFVPGAHVLLHDDVLATGGTATAACKLINKAEGHLIGASFIINLSSLNGLNRLSSICSNVFSIIEY